MSDNFEVKNNEVVFKGGKWGNLKSDKMDEFYSTKEDPWNHKDQVEKDARVNILRPIFEEYKITPRSILDVGCGLALTYHDINELYKLPFMYYGVDVSKVAISQADNCLIDYPSNIKLLVHNMEDSIFTDGLVDLTLIMNTMYYFKGDWRKAALNCLYSTNIGGYILAEDVLVRHQYRDYYKTLPQCELVGEWRVFRKKDPHSDRNLYDKCRLYRRIV